MRYKSLPVAQLESWALLNDSQLHGVRIESNVIIDGSDRGGGLIATSEHDPDDVLLSVSSDLIINKNRVLLEAKTDKYLRELLDALQEFIEIPRKAILVFLLYQMTMNSLDGADVNFGVKSPFTDYVKTLPKSYTLPTFFTDAEYEALEGTSLHATLGQKRQSLEQEFQELRLRTEPVEWCQKIWWHEQSGILTLEDWTLVDAMYRSRALDLPKEIGAAMVPLIDMANHMPDDRCNARFELDSDHRVLLLTQEGRQITSGEEITINYGSGGACESIFSYGFLEEQARSAREMFLSLTIPEDDPLKFAKVRFSKVAPGVRIYANEQGHARFDSDMAFWASVNEEDGLEFELAQTTDGGMELHASWKGVPFTADTLKSIVQADALADVFALRATVMVQDRVERQGELLSMTQDNFNHLYGAAPAHRKRNYDMIRHLRELELQLLMESYAALETEKQQLLASQTIVDYLSRSQRGSGVEADHQLFPDHDEDFS